MCDVAKKRHPPEPVTDAPNSGQARPKDEEIRAALDPVKELDVYDAATPPDDDIDATITNTPEKP